MSATALRRPVSVEELGAAFAKLFDGAADGYVPYVPGEGDVFISSWAKSGTTMTQQIFHQLRMGAKTGSGDMDFDDISRMTPWEDTAPAIGYDMTTAQKAMPRGFKSHREYDRLPEGMRYIVTLRDPKETYVSFFRFMEGWMFEPGTISLDEFLPLWLIGGPGGCDYYTHILSWYARRNEPDTLLADYRWAVKNKRAFIAKVASFIDVELTEELADMVEAHTSREFMYENKDKFDDLMFATAIEQRVGIPADSDSSKVQAEGSDAKVVPAEVAEQIDALWAERVEPATGHADYASLADEVNRLATTS